VREKSSPETRALGLVTICPNTMCPRMMCSNPERGACAPLLTEVTLEAPLYGKSRVSLDDIYEIVRRPWVLSKCKHELTHSKTHIIKDESNSRKFTIRSSEILHSRNAS